MHTQYYNKKGKEVPSVTTVLKVLNKPALVFWANALGFKGKSYKKELNRTAEVGTLVHSFLEDKLNNKLFIKLNKAIELDNQSTQEALSSYYAFRKWYIENKDVLNVLHSEKSLVSNIHGYGGTIDLIAQFEGKNYIIDFKTSSAVHATMFLQLSAYANMAEEYGIEIDRVAILRLDKKTSKYEFVSMSRKKVEGYFKMFLTMKELYNGWNDILIQDWNTIIE